MSDISGNGGANAEQQQAPLNINGQYIKDLSFEAPNSPAIFPELQSAQPEIKVNVDVQANKIETPEAINMFEVVLDIGAELQAGDKVGFIVELKYGGVFTLNVPEEHVGAMLVIECPRILFPFARNIISDATRDGGFVPLLLQPIDFAAMYQANLAQQTQDLNTEVSDLIDKKEGDA